MSFDLPLLLLLLLIIASWKEESKEQRVQSLFGWWLFCSSPLTYALICSSVPAPLLSASDSAAWTNIHPRGFFFLSFKQEPVTRPYPTSPAGAAHLVSLVAVCCRDSSRSWSDCTGRMFFSSSSLLEGRLLSLMARESLRKIFMASVPEGGTR